MKSTVLLLALLGCFALIAKSDYCGMNETYGDLVLKFPTASAGPRFDFWYTDDDPTKYMVTMERMDAFDANGKSYKLAKSTFSSWVWNFDCEITCDSDWCTFEYTGQNQNNNPTMFADLTGHVSNNATSVDSFKFDIHIYGEELQAVLENARRMDITFKFQCTQGSCKDAKEGENDEANVMSPKSYANLDIRGDFVELLGGSEECKLTLNENNEESSTGPCGLADFTLVVNNKKPVISITWEDASSYTEITFDPTIRVGSGSHLVVPFIALAIVSVLSLFL
jgi:hypothetical protein